MRVFITGGTGLIGRRLVERLAGRGDQPVILSRRSDVVRRDPTMRSYSFVQGDPAVPGPWEHAIDGCDAVVNLVGQNIFAKRWDPEVKRQIRDSRVYSTEHVVAAMAKARKRPAVLVQSSAIGYYGPHGDEDLTESSPSGSDFMAVVCREWEDAALPAEALGVRVSRIRTGIVLARGEGALGFMTPLFKLGPGVPIGGDGGPLKPASGRQWMSWIHVDDIVGILLLALDHPEARGPINGTAPNPVRNAEFAKTFSDTLRGPLSPWRRFLPFGPPDALLQLALGEIANVVTKGQRVLPAKAAALGYTFQFPELREALRNLFPPAARARRETPTMAAAGHPNH